MYDKGDDRYNKYLEVDQLRLSRLEVMGNEVVRKSLETPMNRRKTICESLVCIKGEYHEWNLR